MRAHPFMWGKGRRVRDWIVVVRPLELNTLGGKANLCTLVAQSGIALEADEIRWVRGTDPDDGKAVDVVYRRKPSQRRDTAGAPWDFCEGVVLLGRDAGYDPHFIFTAAHLDQAHEACMVLYDRFWNVERWDEEDAAMGWIELDPATDGVPLRVQYAENKYCPPSCQPNSLPPAVDAASCPKPGNGPRMLVMAVGALSALVVILALSAT